MIIYCNTDEDVNYFTVRPKVVNPISATSVDRRFENSSTELICDVISKPLNALLKWTKRGQYITENYKITSRVISDTYDYGVREALRSILMFNLVSNEKSCSDVVKFDGHYTCMVFDNESNVLNSSTYFVNSFCKFITVFKH